MARHCKPMKLVRPAPTAQPAFPTTFGNLFYSLLSSRAASNSRNFCGIRFSSSVELDRNLVITMQLDKLPYNYRMEAQASDTILDCGNKMDCDIFFTIVAD